MLESIPLPVLAILAYLLLVLPLVIVHEFGHFLAARLFGVKVERFSIGFGPTLAIWRSKSGMEWRIAGYPIGGYVKFAGDINAASGVPDEAGLAELKREITAAEGPNAFRRYFHFKPVWQRAIVVAAGPAANFLSAFVLFSILYACFPQPIYPARIQEVLPGSPAAAAGLKSQDLIVRIGDEPIESTLDASIEISLRSNTPTAFGIVRDGRPMTIMATPVRGLVDNPGMGPQQVGRLGVKIGPNRSDVRIPHYTPFEVMGKGAEACWKPIRLTVTYLGRVFTGRENGDAIGGPLRTASRSGAIVKQAIHEGHGDTTLQAMLAGLNLLQLAALISVSVGFVNLLPIPVLDGGHLLFYAYEAVARKPLGARVQEASFRIGLALLAGLMLFATWNDLQKFGVFKNLGGFLS